MISLKLLNNHRKIPILFLRDIGLINDLILSFLPLYLEVRLGNVRRLNKLHVVDIDLLGNQERLLETGLIVVIYIAVDDAEL